MKLLVKILDNSKVQFVIAIAFLIFFTIGPIYKSRDKHLEDYATTEMATAGIISIHRAMNNQYDADRDRKSTNAWVRFDDGSSHMILLPRYSGQVVGDEIQVQISENSDGKKRYKFYIDDPDLE